MYICCALSAHCSCRTVHRRWRTEKRLCSSYIHNLILRVAAAAAATRGSTAELYRVKYKDHIYATARSRISIYRNYACKEGVVGWVGARLKYANAICMILVRARHALQHI